MAEDTEVRAPERPVLTLPPEAAEWVRTAYGDATNILEYGSGGSTVLAAEAEGKTIFSVESDGRWTAMMQSYFDANPPASTVHLHYANIGRVGRWGRPLSDKRWKRYHRYPLGVWDREDFVHPDVILIDGRFRVGCLLTALFRIQKPTLALFDDYEDRGRYAEVEEFVEPVAKAGRMARFELEPTRVPADKLARIMDLFNRVM